MFELDTELLSRIFSKALSRGGDYAEVYAEQTESESLQLMDGQVSQATLSLLSGVGVRVLCGEKTGYSYVMSYEPEDLLRAASSAACIADSTFPQTCAGQAAAQEVSVRHGASQVYAAQEVAGAPTLYPVLTPWTDFAVTRRAAYLKRLEEVTLQLDARVVKVRATLTIDNSRLQIANTLGVNVVDLRPLVSLRLSVVLQQDGKTESGFASCQLRQGAEFLSESLLDRLSQEAVSQASLLFEAIRPEGGEMPVVMAAGESGILLHEAIGHAFEADFNRKNTSIFSDRMGQMICHPSISIVDDGTGMGDAGAQNYDDEGVPAQCTTLVEEGRLVSYLHDRISARHYGVSPTGNGRRQSFRHAPLPRMRSTYMLAGDACEEDVIRSVKRGIYAKSFTNGQVQIGAGDFTFYMKLGFLIEDGHLTTPIRDLNIIGNGPRALADISMVANNLVIDHSAGMCGKGGQSVPVSHGLPTVLVDRLTVG